MQLTNGQTRVPRDGPARQALRELFERSDYVQELGADVAQELLNVYAKMPATPETTHTVASLVAITVESAAMRQGATLRELRVNNAILDKCEAEPEALEFNAEETLKVKAFLEAHKWGRYSADARADLLALADAVEAADASKKAKEGE